MNRDRVFAAAAAVLLAGLIAGAAAHEEKSNKKCPIDAKKVDGKTTSIYVKSVGFCCNKCMGKFDKDPDAFVEKVSKVPFQIVNDACPVSGKKVDPEATARHQGEKIGFCCGRCQAKFEDNPRKFEENIKRTGKAFNKLCFITRRKINAKKVSTFKKVVGFCSDGCRTKFEKDPDKHIAKVK